MIETQKFIRKPLYVDAVRVTNANFDEIATWCQGEVQQDDTAAGHPAGKKYIKVRVHNPKNPRQTKAFVGDWLLYTERGYKVYTNKAFYASFDLAEGFATLVEKARVEKGVSTPDHVTTPPTPIEDVASSDVVTEKSDGTKVISDMKVQSVGPVAEAPTQETGVGEILTVEQATPQGIADAVQENEQARAEEETNTLSPDEQMSEPAEDASTEVPVAPEGKIVLSLDDQHNMDQEEIRNLLQSGEYILAQDLVA